MNGFSHINRNQYHLDCNKCTVADQGYARETNIFFPQYNILFPQFITLFLQYIILFPQRIMLFLQYIIINTN